MGKTVISRGSLPARSGITLVVSAGGETVKYVGLTKSEARKVLSTLQWHPRFKGKEPTRSRKKKRSRTRRRRPSSAFGGFSGIRLP